MLYIRSVAGSQGFGQFLLAWPNDVLEMPIPDPNVARRGARRTTSRSAEVPLRTLDHKTIAVHLVINGRERVLRGVGTFGLDTRLGGILRVTCSDAKGGFDLLFSEKDWKGQIRPGDSLGCDYLVQISSADSSQL